jgi:hypothetical protein
MDFEVVTPKKILLGTQTIELVEDQKLNIRVKLGDEWTDLLDEKVPNGKTWEVNLFVRAAENEV